MSAAVLPFMPMWALIHEMTVSSSDLAARASLIRLSMLERGGAPCARFKVICRAERESVRIKSMYSESSCSRATAMAWSSPSGTVEIGPR